MKKTALPLLTALALSLLLSACGGAETTGSPAASISDGAKGDVFYSVTMDEDPAEMEFMEFNGSNVTGDTLSAGGSVYTEENAKIIRTAELTLQTTEFDEAVEALSRLVEEQGGYYEEASVSGGNYHSNKTSRYASYTVRLPQENFDAFLSTVGELVHVADRRVMSRDVGTAYYDTELRLSTLRTKHERLLALMEEATLMEDIIALESALTDVEYEIQQHSSTLERYDSLIGFSTISISLSEVARVTDTPGETDSFTARVTAAFGEGWASFLDGLADTAVWLAFNAVGVVIFVGAVVVIFLFARRSIRRVKNRHTHLPDPPAPSGDGKNE